MKDNDTDVLSSNMGQGDIIVVSNLLDKTSGLIVCRGSITKCCSFMFRNLYPIKLLNRKDIAFHKFTKRILDKSRYELERHNKNKITIEDRYVLERLE